MILPEVNNMTCPKCKTEFGIAYISKDAPHNRKIECPTCHTLWENPKLNHCVYLETNGKCFRNRKVKCRGELGYELCSDYKERRDNSCQDKPPLGCCPYYMNTSARICSLCEAIKEYSTEKNRHESIRLWATEILCLNEVDRHMEHISRRTATYEEDMK